MPLSYWVINLSQCVSYSLNLFLLLNIKLIHMRGLVSPNF